MGDNFLIVEFHFDIGRYKAMLGWLWPPKHLAAWYPAWRSSQRCWLC